MDQPFAHTLSFDDLEVLVLVEDGGATPREVADFLGMDLEEARALFADLVRRGLLVCQEEFTTFLLPPPWPAACGMMKPSAPRPSRWLSLGRRPKTKAEAGKPSCCRPPHADHQVRESPAAATPGSAAD